MITADHQWGLSNPGPDRLIVWLEPWCDEFEVPVRSTITLKTSGGFDEGNPGDVKWTPDNLVIWGNGRTLEVFIDGVLQVSSSAAIPIPDGLTKQMLSIVFSGYPAARFEGEPFDPVKSSSWWQRVRRRFGL